MRNKINLLFVIFLLILTPLSLAEGLGGLWQLPEPDGQVVFFDEESGTWTGTIVCDGDNLVGKEECDGGKYPPKIFCEDEETGQEGRTQCESDCSGYEDCTPAGVCGDMTTDYDLGEWCDDGKRCVKSDGSATIPCTPEKGCANGETCLPYTESPEECGYGNNCCTADCAKYIKGPSCNDGTLQTPPEECDPEYLPSLFNYVTLDGIAKKQGCLRNDQTVAQGGKLRCTYGNSGYCGDSKAQFELEEDCDDGNTITETPEQCGYDNYCCSEDCVQDIDGRFCGDNIVTAPEEECEDFGATRFKTCTGIGENGKVRCNSQSESNKCNYPTTCPSTGSCGDGETQFWETCDDGNTVTESAEECGYGKVCCNAQCSEPILAGYCTDGEIQSPDEACELYGDTEWKLCELTDGRSGKQECMPDCSAYQEECLICGDGIKHEWEYCDDGNNVEETAAECGYGNTCCKKDCSDIINGLRCGDGIKQDGEVCDPNDETSKMIAGPNGEKQYCLSDCSGYSEGSVCGDGKKQYKEYCDDGGRCTQTGTMPTTICTSDSDCLIAGGTCLPYAETKEECGYENTCCEADCLYPISGPQCGDRKVTNGEVCDTMDTYNPITNPGGTDGKPVTVNGVTEYQICNSDCRGYVTNSAGVCGDSVRQWWAGERCDDGNTITEVYSDVYSSSCSADCKSYLDTPSCWDGIVQPEFGEVCDPLGPSRWRFMVGSVFTDEIGNVIADCTPATTGAATDTITRNTRRQECANDCGGYEKSNYYYFLGYNYLDAYANHNGPACLLVSDPSDTLGNGVVDPWEVCDDGNTVTETPEECVNICCSADGQHIITGLVKDDNKCGDGFISDLTGSFFDVVESSGVYKGFTQFSLGNTNPDSVTITLEDNNFEAEYNGQIFTWQKVARENTCLGALPIYCPATPDKERFLCQVDGAISGYKITKNKETLLSSMIRFTAELFR